MRPQKTHRREAMRLRAAKPRRQEMLETSWHIFFAILAVAGAIYHEGARRRDRKLDR